MPFDPVTYIQSNPFTIEGLVSFLKTRPASEEYIYTDTRRCLAAQFNKHCDRVYSTPGCASNAEKALVEANLNKFVESVALPTPHTMGAALQRAWALSRRL